MGKLLFEKNKTILLISILNILVLSAGHAYNNKILIALSLVMFSFLVISSQVKMFLPLMLFYLPWSTVMKTSPETFSFYTLIVPLFFAVMILKQKKDNKNLLNPFIIIIATLLVVITLCAKIFYGYSISPTYFFFMFLLVFTPTFLHVNKEKISFELCIFYFSAGIISSGFIANYLSEYAHMSQYIDIYEWSSMGLTRLSGFYGDPNFYSSHILVAICGLLIISLRNKFNMSILCYSLAFILIYLGFLSVSKMFIMILIIILALWLISFLVVKEKVTKKFSVFFLLLFSIIIFSISDIFTDEINMYMIRFGMIDSASSLTTGRSDLVLNYFTHFKENFSAVVFGQGFTNILVSNLEGGSHNSLIQAIYQFGIVGAVVILIWLFMLSSLGKFEKTKKSNVFQIYLVAMFMLACFAPWLSLDILFFDEFFYISLLFIIGRNYIFEKL